MEIIYNKEISKSSDSKDLDKSGDLKRETQFTRNSNQWPIHEYLPNPEMS